MLFSNRLLVDLYLNGIIFIKVDLLANVREIIDINNFDTILSCRK